MMGFFSKKEKQLVDVPPMPSAAQPEEEWIWVNGYKATDKNMQCKNNFQYELGKEYTCEGDIVECKNGLHLCMDLGHTFYYYDVEQTPSNRYFKVKALVRKADAESYGKVYSTVFGASNIRTKLVAKQIILTEEVSEEELFDVMTTMYNGGFIDNFDDFETFRSQELCFDDWYKNKYKDDLRGKYSDLFVELIFDYKNWKALCKLALALYEEGVSADVRTYFILKEAGL